MNLLIFLLTLSFQSTLVTDSSDWESKADTVLKYAKDQIGTTYKWGTCKPGESFDCSGFTRYAYSKIGVECPRSSTGLANVGENVSLENCRKGDLLLFRGTDPNDSSVGHVGIVVSNVGSKIEFIHCSSSKRHYGVVVTEYFGSGYPNRFIGVKRLFS